MNFAPDLLFDGYELLTDKVLSVTEDGTVEAILPREAAGADVLVLPGILSPGFINCHCHLELSHMKGLIPKKTGLVDFVSQVIKDRHSPEEKILEAIRVGEDEMLQCGIVAVGDICNNTLTISQKQAGRIWYHNFIEASGFAPAIADQRFQRALDIYKEYAKLYAVPYESNSIVPHAPYSVSEPLWEKIQAFPGNQLMTIHNQETAAEDELFSKGSSGFMTLYQELGIDTSFFKLSGKSSLQTYLARFLPGQSVILVHNVHTNAADLDYARSLDRRQLYWCLCPNANLYIEDRLPDLALLLEKGCSIVLGTDSLASNDQLSILAEMQTIRQHFPFITTSQLFSWATLNGARALQLDKLLGSFEPGKKPGLVLCDPELRSAHRII